jgi:methylmalonyl-CoA mutase
MTQNFLFADFQPFTAEQWQAQIEKDLKGKPYDDLRWHIGDDFVVDPFYTNTDIAEKKQAFSASADWEISESIEIENEDYKAANRLALDALMGGANALEFIISYNTSAAEMEVLLKGIELSYISTHFFYTGKKINQAQKKIEHFYTIAKKRGENTDALQGSLHIAPLGHAPNWDKVAATCAWFSMHLPAFKCITVNGCSFHTEPEHVAVELGETLFLANSFFNHLTDRNYTPSQINAVLQFSISVDKSYFINIAKIRALKLLYLNLMKAYHIENEALAPIEANFASLSFDENVNTNMIRATTMALSAVSGGVARLNVLPADPKNTPFTRRIARNVQHLLKMESYLDKVADPSAGSYYIEQLTEMIATKTWDYFQKKQ